jgi:hypothetical protein
MGESEKIIGKLISETPAEQRKNVIIATKCRPFICLPRLSDLQNSPPLIEIRASFPESYELVPFLSRNRLLFERFVEEDGFRFGRVVPSELFGRPAIGLL